MFKEVSAKEAVNALIDGNENVFAITHVGCNVKISRLNDFSINILVDPQIKNGYRYIVDYPNETESLTKMVLNKHS